MAPQRVTRASTRANTAAKKPVMNTPEKKTGFTTREFVLAMLVPTVVAAVIGWALARSHHILVGLPRSSTITHTTTPNIITTTTVTTTSTSTAATDSPTTTATTRAPKPTCTRPLHCLVVAKGCALHEQDQDEHTHSGTKTMDSVLSAFEKIGLANPGQDQKHCTNVHVKANDDEDAFVHGRLPYCWAEEADVAAIHHHYHHDRSHPAQEQPLVPDFKAAAFAAVYGQIVDDHVADNGGRCPDVGQIDVLSFLMGSFSNPYTGNVISHDQIVEEGQDTHSGPQAAAGMEVRRQYWKVFGPWLAEENEYRSMRRSMQGSKVTRDDSQSRGLLKDRCQGEMQMCAVEGCFED